MIYVLILIFALLVAANLLVKNEACKLRKDK